MPAGAELKVRIDRKRHGGSRGVVVIEDLALTVAAGEVVALVGPSGCGKTTALAILAGLDGDFEGSVLRPPGRLAMVFQTPRLLPWRTVRDNLLLAEPPGGAAAVDRLLGEVGLHDCADAFPGHLSLGMQRRAAVARAFAVEPDLLLLDEPFVSLDAANAGSLRALLRTLLAGRRCTVVMVTHDLREAVELADRILFLTAAPMRVAMEVPVRLAERSEEAVAAFARTLG